MPVSIALFGAAFIYGMCLTGTLISAAILASSSNLKNVRANLGPANAVLVILMISSIVTAALGH